MSAFHHPGKLGAAYTRCEPIRTSHSDSGPSSRCCLILLAPEGSSGQRALAPRRPSAGSTRTRPWTARGKNDRNATRGRAKIIAPVAGWAAAPPAGLSASPAAGARGGPPEPPESVTRVSRHERLPGAFRTPSGVRRASRAPRLRGGGQGRYGRGVLPRYDGRSPGHPTEWHSKGNWGVMVRAVPAGRMDADRTDDSHPATGQGWLAASARRRTTQSESPAPPTGASP